MDLGFYLIAALGAAGAVSLTVLCVVFSQGDSDHGKSYLCVIGSMTMALLTAAWLVPIPQLALDSKNTASIQPKNAFGIDCPYAGEEARQHVTLHLPEQREGISERTGSERSQA